MFKPEIEVVKFAVEDIITTSTTTAPTMFELETEEW